MKIPLRIKQIEVMSSESKFSFWDGLQTLWFNLKMLFTHRIMVSGNGWQKTIEDSKVVDDISLVFATEDIRGTVAKFIKTPEGSHDTALEITQVRQ